MKATVSSLRQARQIRQVFGPVLERLDEVDQFFLREFERAQPMVRDVATYVLGSGGKRLRPAFVLLVSRMLGYTGERDVRYGAVVEMINTATTATTPTQRRTLGQFPSSHFPKSTAASTNSSCFNSFRVILRAIFYLLPGDPACCLTAYPCTRSGGSSTSPTVAGPDASWWAWRDLNPRP